MEIDLTLYCFQTCKIKASIIWGRVEAQVKRSLVRKRVHVTAETACKRTQRVNLDTFLLVKTRLNLIIIKRGEKR